MQCSWARPCRSCVNRITLRIQPRGVPSKCRMKRYSCRSGPIRKGACGSPGALSSARHASSYRCGAGLAEPAPCPRPDSVPSAAGYEALHARPGSPAAPWPGTTAFHHAGLEQGRRQWNHGRVDSASERLRTEIHRTTLSLGGKVRAFATSLLSGGPAAIDWPPVDVVLLERATGQVVKRWHEHGNDAVVFMSALDEDLDGMTLDEFLEKWGVSGVEGS